MSDNMIFENIEAEQSVIGGLMLNNAAIDDVCGLKPEHFSLPAHQILYRMIEWMIQNGKPADVITVFEVLQRKNKLDEVGGMVYLNQLVTSVSSSALVKRYAEIVIDRSKRKSVYQGAMAIAAAVSGEGLTGEQAIERAGEVLQSFDSVSTTDDCIPVFDAVQAFLTDLESRAGGISKDVIPSGFSFLDNSGVLDGGFERGQLAVVGGRTSMGKTTLAFNFLMNMANSVKKMVVSLEMSNNQLIRRCAASIGSVSMKSLKTGVDKMTDSEWKGVTYATESLTNKNLFIQQKSTATAYGICASARRQKRKYGLDVLVVDHLGLMNHGDGNANTAEKIGDTTKALKHLAQELNIVVILLVQINRAAAGAAGGDVKRPSRENLRDSGRIEEDADVIMLIHRDDHYRIEESKTHDGHTHLICDKVRDGEPMTLNLKFEGQFSRFVEWHGAVPYVEKKQYKTSGRDRQAGMN